MYTEHNLEIKVTDNLNNTVGLDYSFDMTCNFMTALTALHSSYSYLLTALDAYAVTKGYASAKEMPKNFKQTLNLKEVLEATKQG